MSNRLNWKDQGVIAYAYRNGISGGRISQNTMNILDAEPWTGSSTNEMTYDQRYLSINFPRPVFIDAAAVLGSSAKWYYIEISDDTQDTTRPGDYGTWSQVGYGVTAGNVYTKWDMHSPVASRWVRLRCDRWNITNYAVHLFGYYLDPAFDLYDQGGTLITDPNWMDWSIAYSDINWTETKIFKIKNNSLVSSTYDIILDQQNYHDVTFVTDHFKLSNGVVSDVTSLTTASVAPGAFSEDITVTGTIDIIDNPLGGQYWPKVTINEVQV